MAHDRSISIGLCEPYCIDGFSNGSDLVHFYKDAVGNTPVNSLLQAQYVGHEKIIPHQLAPVAH